MWDNFNANKQQDQSLTKRTKVLENDILAERIAIDKARIEEQEETHRLEKSGQVRISLQKELETAEQKDTMAKFELFELKKVHEELKNALAHMKQQNSNLVDPVLDKLRKEVRFTPGK